MNYVKNNPCNLNKNMNYKNNIHVKQSTNQAFSLICTQKGCTSQERCNYCRLEQKLIFLLKKLRILSFSYQRYGAMIGCSKQTIWRAVTHRIRNNRLFYVGQALRREKKRERHLFYTIKIQLSHLGKKLLHGHVDGRNLSYIRKINNNKKQQISTIQKILRDTNSLSYLQILLDSRNKEHIATQKRQIAFKTQQQEAHIAQMKESLCFEQRIAHLNQQAQRALQESTQMQETERAKVLERLAQLGFNIG